MRKKDQAVTQRDSEQERRDLGLRPTVPGRMAHGEKSGENGGHLECSGWSGSRKGDVAAQAV